MATGVFLLFAMPDAWRRARPGIYLKGGPASQLTSE
jgi:hypothetical protein